ncbi:MAG: ABC transporter ATP-binding protein [Planctomycetota bacterium]
MRGRIESSKSRYSGYFRERTKSRATTVVAERTQARDERLKAKRKRPLKRLIATFWTMLRGRRGLVAACLGTVTIATLIGLTGPYSIKIIIDHVLNDEPGPAGLPAWVPFAGEAAAGDSGARLGLLAMIVVAVLVLNIVAAGVSLWGRYQCTRVMKLLQIKMRRDAFEHAIRLPLTRVSDLKTGGVSSVLREDAGNAGELLFSLVYNPWRAIVQFVGTLIVISLIEWRLVIGALTILPIVWISHRTWIARIRPVYRDIRRTRQTIDAQATESFGGIRVVRAFHRGHAEEARFTRDGHFMTRQELLAWWWSRLLEVAWQVIIPLASAGVLLYGGWRVLEGGLTVGELMAFSAYILSLLGPLESLVSTAAQVQSGLAGFDRTLDLLEEPAELESSNKSATVPVNRPTIRGEIALEDVWFRYPRPRPMTSGTTEEEAERLEAEAQHEDMPWVLRGVSLRAQPGQTIALVGVSGSGKTTLCNLVARFYDPTQGRLTLDGRDLREWELDGYRRLLGVVEQDVFLFDGTVAENIAYSRREATMADIRAAAEAANALGFIDGLEDGFESLIGERGVRLSGGQKQRLAIARAILADPKVLILDEATSSLDTESERLIQASLETLMRDRTSFVIAHRLSTIRDADMIAVLEDGQLAEVGTHDELIAADGRYAMLAQMQTASTPQTLGN